MMHDDVVGVVSNLAVVEVEDVVPPMIAKIAVILGVDDTYVEMVALDDAE